MRLIFVLLLNVLLLNGHLQSCLHGYLSANVNIESSNGDIEQQNSSENGTKIQQNPSQIQSQIQGQSQSQSQGDLNEDFEWAMFDTFDLEEMLQLAKDSRYSDFVKKHIFPVKYHNYEFWLSDDDEDIFEGVVNVLPDAMHITDYDLFIDVIVHFGQSIRRLFISHFDLSDDQYNNLHRYVNEYCCESLISITLFGCPENQFSLYKKPFSRLQVLRVDIETQQIGHILPFNELFPKLQELSLHTIVSDSQFIVSELPHLKRLSIGLHFKNCSDLVTAEKQFASLLEKNPQIQNICYSGILGDFITTIKRCLPRLEYFSVFDVNDQVESVQFDDVKEFQVTSSTLGPVERFSFPCLETLQLYYSWKYFAANALNSWRSFFKRHQNVRKIICDTTDSKGLVEFISTLPNLQEIEINCMIGVSFDLNLISRFIEKNEYLLRFQFRGTSFLDEPDLAFYREKFGREWLVDYAGEGWPKLTIEKKRLSNQDIQDIEIGKKEFNG